MNKPRANNADIKRIAVFSRGDPLGDGLFKLPFIQSLRATFINAEICWVTSRRSAYTGPIAELVAPYLDKVVSETGITESTWDAVFPKKAPLGPIDIAIDTQTVALRTIAIRRALPAKIFLSASTNYALSTIRPPANNIFKSTKPKHLVDHLMVLLRLASNGEPTLDMSPPAIPQRFTDLAASLLSDTTKTYVGFAPGSGDTSKRWPLERFLALAKRVSASGALPVFFIGPNERDLIEQTRQALPEAIFPEEGLADDAPTGPLLVCALGQHLKAAVANDSGLGHMLALPQIPLVLLFGRHSPEKYAPRTPRLHPLWAENYGGHGLDLITYEDVEKALLEALATPE